MRMKVGASPILPSSNFGRGGGGERRGVNRTEKLSEMNEPVPPQVAILVLSAIVLSRETVGILKG